MCLLALPSGLTRSEKVAFGLAAALFVCGLVLFPFGLMDRQYVPRVAARWAEEQSRPIAYEEALTETVMIARHDSFGRPESYRLITNGMAMSGTTYSAGATWRSTSGCRWRCTPVRAARC